MMNDRSSEGGAYPRQAAITAYGNGGFRFADMSHRGSILCLPTGMFAWDGVESGAALVPVNFMRVVEMLRAPAVFLLGTGATQIFPSPELRGMFAEAGIGIEPMSTGAAARTYNILLAEGRLLGAGLIAVD